MLVLCVDDDSVSRDLLALTFRSAGHEVLLAADGVEALALVADRRPDIAISDILMPRMDGYQLCINWRRDSQLSDIPFVFHTATYVEDADREFSLNLGADDFLSKPMDPAALLERIEAIVAGAVPRRPYARMDEVAVLREYNSRLVDKLEKKVADLEKANADLKKAIHLLSDEMDVKNRLIERLTAGLQEFEKRS